MFIITILIIIILFLVFLCYRLHSLSKKYEDYYKNVYTIFSEYKKLLDSLFELNIMYYDDTIYEFIQKTKEYREQVKEVMEEFIELQEFLDHEPEETPKEQPKEVLGVVKPFTGYEGDRNVRQ